MKVEDPDPTYCVWNPDKFDPHENCYQEFWIKQDKRLWSECCALNRDVVNCGLYIPSDVCFTNILIGQTPCDNSLHPWLQCCQASCWSLVQNQNCEQSAMCSDLLGYMAGAYSFNTPISMYVLVAGEGFSLFIIITTSFIIILMLIRMYIQMKSEIHNAPTLETYCEYTKTKQGEVIGQLSIDCYKTLYLDPNQHGDNLSLNIPKLREVPKEKLHNNDTTYNEDSNYIDRSRNIRRRENGYKDGVSNGTVYDNNTAYNNTAYNNTAYNNTAYNNTGYNNTGYNNTGYNNTGYNNTGYNNTGYRDPQDIRGYKYIHTPNVYSDDISVGKLNTRREPHSNNTTTL